ncbi:hypothetical protein FHR81_004995 [Actinoalloteichus hoggarensis]|uniref:Uncharacterized protein n=1 Tax=Actinoalloteichus hoggarensis TaxID=1470176 RepID=A0A221W7W3_9PSEU|nr:hypothetical protein [Actinoalloteichus hoggarensis]ASO21998.1 hypothetical protein AHOG_21910 [Actinoalloteichus hoggarensis]MBB5923922.1 hypothetical protein [Actinoalloteichus hoggarensis]
MSSPTPRADVVDAARELIDLGEERAGATLDLSRSPAAAERLGRIAADELRGHAVDLVVAWDDARDAVLSHIAARELGVARVTVYEDLGQLIVAAHRLQGARLGVVFTTEDDRHDPGPLTAITTRSGGEVVATVVVVRAEELAAASEES